MAFIIRNTMAEGYRIFASLEKALNSSDATFRKILDLDAPPEIEPPIYFHYLDESRVAGLYNQIEPELEENAARSHRTSDSQRQSKRWYQRSAGVGVEAGSENQKEDYVQSS